MEFCQQLEVGQYYQIQIFSRANFSLYSDNCLLKIQKNDFKKGQPCSFLYFFSFYFLKTLFKQYRLFLKEHRVFKLKAAFLELI